MKTKLHQNLFFASSRYSLPTWKRKFLHGDDVIEGRKFLTEQLIPRQAAINSTAHIVSTYSHKKTNFNVTKATNLNRK